MVFRKEEEDHDLYENCPGQFITFTPVNGPSWLKEVTINIHSFKTGEVEVQITVDQEIISNADAIKKSKQLVGFKQISELTFLSDDAIGGYVDEVRNAIPLADDIPSDKRKVIAQVRQLINKGDDVSDQCDIENGSISIDATSPRSKVMEVLRQAEIPRDIQLAVEQKLQKIRTKTP